MKKANFLKSFLPMILLLCFGLTNAWGQIISQYVETNSGTTPKGIEIWNNTSNVLDFSANNLIIQQGTNGGSLSDISQTLINSGTLGVGEVLVIGTSDIGTYLNNQGLSSVTFLSYAFSFNGDDALAVKFGGVITDVFGNPGSDPGSGWSGNGVSTENQNIALIESINTGSTGFTDPSTRFTTISTTPATLPAGLSGFGISPVTIEPEDPPVVTPETFNGAVGIAASFQIQATESPNSYAIASGTLPAGLSLNTTNGLISGTPTNAGNSSVTVTATNDAGTSAAATLNFEIAQGTQTIANFIDLIKYIGDESFQLTETTNAGLTISYSSSDTDVATISGNTVTIAGLGETTITATQAGNSNWNPLNQTILLTVNEAPAGTVNLFFSEYIEGTSNNKYIEIYNGTGASVNLNEYSVELYANGAASPSNTQNLGSLLASLDNGQVIVLKNSGATIYTGTAYSSGVTNFNGDDAIVLKHNGNIIDIIGQIGCDPGTVWEEGGNSMLNSTLVRKSNVCEGIIENNAADCGFPTLGTEWDSLPIDDISNLGSHTADCSGSTDTIWNGNEWSNNEPDENTNAIIDGELIVGTDLTDLVTANLTITSNGSLIIQSGNSVTVSGKIINDAGAENFVVQNDANLIQNTGTTLDNDGEITVLRNSQPFKRLDYTMWSSPVAGQGLQGFSPETLPNRIYTYEDDDYYEVDDATADFTDGKGYLFRAPNDWSADTPTAYQGSFVGIPFNGNINVGTHPGSFTSIGNPYASNIDADLFLGTNGGVSTLYFWTNTNPVVDGTYSGNNYATYTLMGGAGTSGAENDEANAPNGFISTGQGFIVESTGSSVEFNNGMRVSDTATFFKVDETDKHRFWLNLRGDNQGYNQILIGYMTGATNGLDHQIDGKMFGYEGSALYNSINDNKYTIQGRALPFETTDVVPLGFKAVESGEFTISLIGFDGLFSEGETTVYLKDYQSNVIHNLMESDYTFQSEAGEFNDRFEVVYEDDGTMGIEDLISNSVQIYKHNQNIVVTSKSEKILSVELFDLQGRNIHRNTEVNANTYQINTASKGVLIVRTQTQNGQIITKKILNN